MILALKQSIVRLCAIAPLSVFFVAWKNKPNCFYSDTALTSSPLTRSLKLFWEKAWMRLYFFDKAPSFEAREAHQYLNNWLGIFHARGGGLLDNL